MSSKFLLSTFKRSASTSVPKLSLPVFDFFAATKPSVNYRLGHGAAGFAKNRPQLPLLSVPTRHVQVGEDAYFRRSDAIGVADGVSGWMNTEGKPDFTVLYFIFIFSKFFLRCKFGIIFQSNNALRQSRNGPI